MTKKDLARILAKNAGMPQATAADHLDRVVHDIVCKLRSGNAVPLPGLGILQLHGKRGVKFKPELGCGRGKGNS
ncbi:MAG: HU family DNA-binding protein [Bryobacterales bacterium]|nr:HU family DNA-binding protein [Bryobacterales bacterium]